MKDKIHTKIKSKKNPKAQNKKGLITQVILCAQ